MNALLAVPLWLLSLLPDLELPAQLVGTGPGTLLGGVQSVAGAAGSFDAWVPMSDAVKALGFLLTCVLFAVTVKLLRLVIGYLPGFGGSQA